MMAFLPLIATAAQTSPVLAGRGRLLQKLLEGDPVAWSCLAGVLVVMGGWSFYKSKKNNGQADQTTPQDSDVPPG
jgi:hypothetical protein